MHLTNAASRELRKLDRQAQQNLVLALEELKSDPRPLGMEKLSGHPDFYRIRRGDHRIIFALPQRDLVVVCAIRNRKNSYRGLGRLKATLNHAIDEFVKDELGRPPLLKPLRNLMT